MAARRKKKPTRILIELDENDEMHYSIEGTTKDPSTIIKMLTTTINYEVDLIGQDDVEIDLFDDFMEE